MQTTISAVTNDDGTLSDEQAPREVLAGWETMAASCEGILTTMHPSHPQRGEFLAMRAAFRVAARLPERPFLWTVD